MKHQQVQVDYWTMFKTSFLCLFLAFSGYILIKMVQTIFWLPSHLKRNQQRLEQLAAHYSLEMNRGIENTPSCNGSGGGGAASQADDDDDKECRAKPFVEEYLDDIDQMDREAMSETRKLLDEIAESKKGK